MSKAKKAAAAPAEGDSFEEAISGAEAAAPAAPPAPAAKPAPALSAVDAFFAQCSARSASDDEALAKQAKANPDWAKHVNSDGFNALTLALLAKKPALAEALIDLGSDLDCTSKGMGWNPLTVAAASHEGSDSVAFKLLAKGADPFAKNHMGLFAITSACTYGNLPLAKALLDAGVPATPEGACWLPIISAAGSSNEALVELLLARGADVNAALSPRNKFGSLHQAVKSGEPGMVKLLISKGADVAAMTHEGETPLHLAAARGMAAIAKQLLKAGAPTHLENIFGKIPADLAADPAFAASLAPKQERAKHPMSGRKPKKAVTVDETPEPGIKVSPAKKAAAKKTAAKKPASKASEAKPALKALTKSAVAKAPAKKAKAKAAAVAPKAPAKAKAPAKKAPAKKAPPAPKAKSGSKLKK